MSQDERPEDEEGHVPQAAPGEQAALLALPDRQREAVVLRNLMGLSEKQAAAAMSISIGAMRSHLAPGQIVAPAPARLDTSWGRAA